jgi:hypothetical protein
MDTTLLYTTDKLFCFMLYVNSLLVTLTFHFESGYTQQVRVKLPFCKGH